RRLWWPRRFGDAGLLSGRLSERRQLLLAAVRRRLWRSATRAAPASSRARPSVLGFLPVKSTRIALEHDPERWKPVFGQDQAPTQYLGHDPIQYARIMLQRLLQSANHFRPKRLAFFLCAGTVSLPPLAAPRLAGARPACARSLFRAAA